MSAVEQLRPERPGSLHSRKLRRFAEVAFHEACSSAEPMRR